MSQWSAESLHEFHLEPPKGQSSNRLLPSPSPSSPRNRCPVRLKASRSDRHINRFDGRQHHQVGEKGNGIVLANLFEVFTLERGGRLELAVAPTLEADGFGFDEPVLSVRITTLEYKAWLQVAMWDAARADERISARADMDLQRKASGEADI